ncbi:MAG TPA: ABC transporter ATP-binding protein [Acidimicrobiales bacterium]
MPTEQSGHSSPPPPSPPPPPPSAIPILRIERLRKQFGGIVAVDVERLDVARGTITALVGPNGAGKTTLFNLVCGFDRPQSGSWFFDGRDVSGRPAHRIARSGMIRTFQLTKALSKMSVLDNMLVAGAAQRGEHLLSGLVPPTWRSQERALVDRAAVMLERFELDRMASEYAGTLSGGQRKLLELARALMAEPSMLLLDEPTAGVNPVLVQSILTHVLALRDDGMTILFVEHNMDVVMSISGRVVCMAEGRVIADGSPDAVAADDAVIDAYLGRRREA